MILNDSLRLIAFDVTKKLSHRLETVGKMHESFQFVLLPSIMRFSMVDFMTLASYDYQAVYWSFLIMLHHIKIHMIHES